MGSNIAIIRAYYKKGGISGRVGIRGRVGISSRVNIGVSPGKDIFGPSGVTLLLYRALFIVYSRGVSKWASLYWLKMQYFYYIALIVFYC